MRKNKKPYVIEGRFLAQRWFKGFAWSYTWGFWGRYKTKRDRVTAITALRQSHRDMMEFRFRLA